MTIESTPKEIPDAFDWGALGANTVACAAAAAYMFGPAVALTCAVANVVFSKLGKESPERWFPISDEKVGTQVAEAWQRYPFFKAQIAGGLIFRWMASTPRNLAFEWVKNSVGAPLRLFCVLVQICVVWPLAQETFFRGFLQEKIRNLQVCFFGKEEVDGEFQRYGRIFLQAAAYSLYNYRLVYSPRMMFSTAVFGWIFGEMRERNKNLCANSFSAVHLNTSGCVRTLLIGY